MKRKQLNRRELILLAVVAAIVAGMAIERAVYFTRRKFFRLDAEVKLAEAQLGRLYTLFVNRAELEADVRLSAEKAKQIKDSDGFIQVIESYAKRAGLNIVNIRPRQARQENTHTVYAVEIDAQDQVYVLAKFLNAVVSDFDSVGVQHLQINAPQIREIPRMSLVLSALALKE
jgi:hypothetical protein